MRTTRSAFGLILIALALLSFHRGVLAQSNVAHGDHLPPPTLSLVRVGEGEKTLELPYPEIKTVQYQVTKHVPETRVKIENGVERQETVMRPVTETATRNVCVTVCRPVNIADVELRTVAGQRYKSDDIAAAIGKEFVPVILVNRQLTEVAGKPVAKVMKFDLSYRGMFKPETLVLVLPAPTPIAYTENAPAVSPGAVPTPATPVPAAPTPAPVVKAPK